MEDNSNHSLPYPRLIARRKVLGAIGKFLVRVLAKPQIEGLENIPKEGPVILAGNHVSTLEPVFMFLYTKHPVEPMGAGDMPFEGAIDQIVSYYGYIPVNRGQLDRKAMNQALSVLKQNGFLGIYPEGGTWDPGNMRAQIGIAWLSHKGQARVVPMGFSGFRDSWSKIFKFKRPKLTMKVGQPIPSLVIESDDRSVKEIYQEYADLVLERIQALIDPADKLAVPVRSEFTLDIQAEDGKSINLPDGDAVAQFLFNPVLLDSLYINLKKPVKLLYPGAKERSVSTFRDALEASLEILDENPAFLTYRLGMERGRQVESGIRALSDFLTENSSKDQRLLAKAYYFYPDGRVEEHENVYDLAA